MKSCEECEYLIDFGSCTCRKKWKITKHRSKRYRKEHFNTEVFYKNIFLGFDINCPDFIQVFYHKDPYG